MLQQTSRCVGMADDADSKSVVGNHVWVQVPPPALYSRSQILITQGFAIFLLVTKDGYLCLPFYLSDIFYHLLYSLFQTPIYFYHMC